MATLASQSVLPGPWNNPSLTQMVEDLQVLMMTMNSPLEPLPIEYNSHVLHILEGFGKLQSMLNEANRRLAALGEDKEKSQDDLRHLSAEWVQQEATYKAEIKRLELIIAKTSREGMATVALARGGTLVDRQRTRGLVARLQRMSNSHETDNLGNDTTLASAGLQDLTNAQSPPRKVSASHRQLIPSNSTGTITDKDKLASDTIRGRDASTCQRKEVGWMARTKIPGIFLSLGQTVEEENAETRAQVRLVADKPLPACPQLSNGTDELLSKPASATEERTAVAAGYAVPSHDGTTATIRPLRTNSSSSTSSGLSSDAIEMRGKCGHGRGQVALAKTDIAVNDDLADMPSQVVVSRYRRRGFSFVAGDDSLVVPGLRRPSSTGSLGRASSSSDGAEGLTATAAPLPSTMSPYNIVARVAAARALARGK